MVILEEKTLAGEGPEDLQSVVEKLKVENEKLFRKYEGLKEELTKESSRASSLHYIPWKTTEDNKTLKMNLAGAESQAKLHAVQVERFKREIKELKELLKKQGQYDNVCEEKNREDQQR
ncbi:MAG: hypothetical protein NTY64_20115 [Deltaproteobacteria bacterium]|nr:hypothetical protein [Deltaproteobacteria bacterium]